MGILAELLAAEGTAKKAWEELLTGTLAKFKKPESFYSGHSKRLQMIEATPENENLEDEAAEEKPVITTVYDTLEFALRMFVRSEDLQCQKNCTNRIATGTVEWQGQAFLEELPIDELLGLEDRLAKLRALLAEMPTQDASRQWKRAPNLGNHVYEIEHPEYATKTKKTPVPIELSKATEQHPANVQLISEDVVVGKFKNIKRTGAATAWQKSEVLMRIDELIIEIKKARQRANETQTVDRKIGFEIVRLLLEPFQTGKSA
jgi:hypothetical protein